MVSVEFASSITRHATVTESMVSPGTLSEVLDRIFADHPILKGYVLDDQGSVRKHVAVFINDRTIRDRDRLTDLVKQDDRVYVIQALSGG